MTAAKVWKCETIRVEHDGTLEGRQVVSMEGK